MKILDRLPIYREPALLTVQDEVVQVWRNQIVVWVSLGGAGRPFPAILDTGHSHNFAIARRHLDRWSGAELTQVGLAKIGRETVPQFAADLLIHRNVPGRRNLRGAYPLSMDQGISVVPDDSPLAPRLPLLGLRAILHNGLKLIVDGERGEVSLRKGGWGPFHPRGIPAIA
jgi:hypothetical protein